eukprot:8933777-Pyramimonas_sp.AAC.1
MPLAPPHGQSRRRAAPPEQCPEMKGEASTQQAGRRGSRASRRSAARERLRHSCTDQGGRAQRILEVPPRTTDLETRRRT